VATRRFAGSYVIWLMPLCDRSTQRTRQPRSGRGYRASFSLKPFAGVKNPVTVPSD
jgi:hypothetical protein